MSKFPTGYATSNNNQSQFLRTVNVVFQRNALSTYSDDDTSEGVNFEDLAVRDVATLQAQNSELREMVQNLTAQVASLQTGHSSLLAGFNTECEAYSIAEKKFSQAKKKIERREQQINTLIETCGNLNSQKASLQSRVDALTQKIENLNSQKEQNETQFANLEQQYQILQSENTQSSEKISRLVSEAEQLQSINDQLQTQIENLESQKAETESNLRTIEQNLSNLISRINRIDAQDEKRAACYLEGLLHLVDEGFLSEDKLAVTSVFWQDALTTRDQIQSILDVLNDRNMGLDYWRNQFVEKMVSLLSSGDDDVTGLYTLFTRLRDNIYYDFSEEQWRGFLKEAVHQAVSRFASSEIYRHIESNFGEKWAELYEFSEPSFPWLDDEEENIVKSFFGMYFLLLGMQEILQGAKSLSQRVIQEAKPIIEDAVLKAQEAERNADCEEIIRRLKSDEDVTQFITKYDGLENVYKLLMNFLADKAENEIFSNQSILNWEYAKDVKAGIDEFKKCVELGLRQRLVDDENITEIDKLKIVLAEGHMNLISCLSEFWHVSGYGNEGEELTRILDNKFSDAQKILSFISGEDWEYFLKTFNDLEEIGQIVKFLQNRFIG
ncbi:MAG: hypothetical protein K2L13_00855, partial [Opitutales bacterium]|nr:hypothetical protein [Opitutales bacterium]